jgi:D-alanine-D-alanine ligase-like ATP-grasp enzyme
MNRTLAAIEKAAVRRGIHCTFPAGVTNDDFMQLSFQGRTLLIEKTKTPYLSSVHARLANNKFLSGQVLAAADFPTAEKRLSFDLEAEDIAFLKLHDVLVVKPNALDRGVGITLGVRNETDLQRAYAKAAGLGGVLLERQVLGREYRVLVIDKQAVAVLEWRTNGSNEEWAVDRSKQAHPQLLSMAVDAARLLSIDVAGVDLICPDIAAPFQRDTETAILEVNPGPDILWHLHPSEGQPQPVDDLFLRYLFPLTT